MKRTASIALLSLVAIILFSTVSGAAISNDNWEKNSIVRTIIIDPGHGGKDYPGAIGPAGLLEKTVTLSIGLKLYTLLSSDQLFIDDNVKVILTRDRDVPLSQEERAEVANSNSGDLFISIHANGFGLRSAKGAETYFLGLKASDEHAAMVAEMENDGLSSSTLQANNKGQSDDLKMILFDFIQKQYMAESKFLAEHIQDELNTSINNGDRGVRQNMFRVLKGVAMPAVLVEVDFITNPDRERLLQQESYQWRFAQSIFKAIKEYKQLKERGNNPAAQEQ
jgi:N-acetylmuramoyl-L-alanine amidase